MPATQSPDSPVRMILMDYDAAPDGEGTYEKLNDIFSSPDAAIAFRERFFPHMYWGRIETLDGQLLLSVEEGV